MPGSVGSVGRSESIGGSLWVGRSVGSLRELPQVFEALAGQRMRS